MGSFQFEKVATWGRDSSPRGDEEETLSPSSSQRHEVPFPVTTTARSSSKTDIAKASQALSSHQRFKPKEEMARRFQTAVEEPDDDDGTSFSSSSSSPQSRVARSTKKQQHKHRAFQETNIQGLNYPNKIFAITDILPLIMDHGVHGRDEEEDVENDTSAASSSLTQLTHVPEGTAVSTRKKKVPPIILRKCDLIPGGWRTDGGRGHHGGGIRVETNNHGTQTPAVNDSSPQPQRRDAPINPTLCEIRCHVCRQRIRVDVGESLIECEKCGDLTILL